MPDICTLVVTSIQTLAMCFAPPSCAPEKDGKVLCVPAMPRACPPEPPLYECKREDGSTYMWHRD